MKKTLKKNKSNKKCKTKQKGKGCNTRNDPKLNTIPKEDEMNKPIKPECIKNYYREYSQKQNNKDTGEIFSEASMGSLNIMQTLAGLNCNIYQPHNILADNYEIDTLNFELQLKEEFQDNIFIKDNDHLENSIQFSRYVLNPKYWDSQGTVFGQEGFPRKPSTRGMKWNLILKGDLLYIIFRGSCYDEVMGGNYHSSPLISVSRIAEKLGDNIQLDKSTFDSVLRDNLSRYTIEDVNTNKEGKRITGEYSDLKTKINVKYEDLESLEEKQNQIWYEELFTPCVTLNYASAFLYMNNRLTGSYLPVKQSREYTDPLLGYNISDNLNLSGFPEIMPDVLFETNTTDPPSYILNANRNLHYIDYGKMDFKDIEQQYNNICNYNGQRRPTCKEIEQDLFFNDIVQIHNSLKEVNGQGLKGIIVSGHSRGGGMSFISSFFLRNHIELKDIPIATLPFAPVRPGNYLFGDLYNKTNYKIEGDMGLRVYLDWDSTATSAPKLEGGKKTSKKTHTRNKTKRGGGPTQLSIYNAIKYYFWSQPSWNPTQAITYLLEHQQVLLEHTNNTRVQWNNDKIWQNYLSSAVDGLFLEINSNFDKVSIRVDDRNDRVLKNKQIISFTREDIDRIVNEKSLNQDLLHFFAPDRNIYDAKIIADNNIHHNTVQGGSGEHSMGKLATLIFILNNLGTKSTSQWNSIIQKYFPYAIGENEE